jgi:integrase
MKKVILGIFLCVTSVALWAQNPKLNPLNYSGRMYIASIDALTTPRYVSYEDHAILSTEISVPAVEVMTVDVDFKNNGIKVHRKGGAEVIVYFGDEVMDALVDYMIEREMITPVDGHGNALFLSLQNRRITVRAVENLVKKYSKLVTNVKNITPHKLRSTYGTTLYQETGDIYLVADVLGHKDVNTTRKHYADLEDDRRRRAGRVVKLRDI